MSITNKRFDWIDILRGIAISLVVVGHNQWLDLAFPVVHHTIYVLHVPLFFFISGLTLKKSWDWDNLLSRPISLIVCYFLFSLVLSPLSFIKNPEVPVQDVFLGILYGTGHTIHMVPMWFLTCLAITLFFTVLLINILPSSKPLLFLVSIFLILAGSIFIQYYFNGADFTKSLSWGKSITESGLFWNCDLVLLASGYILLGYVMKDSLLIVEQKSHLRVFQFLLVSLFIFLLLALRFDLNVEFNKRIFEPFLYAFLGSMSGILLSVFASILIAKSSSRLKQLLILTGKSTLIILIFHSGLQTNFSKLLNLNLWASVLIILFVITVCVAFDALIIKKYPIISKVVYFKPKLR